MGRQALRKVDPELDLSSYLLTFEDLPEVSTSAALFGREAPLEIEVGSGKGLFMATACESCPERNFLGLEIAKKYAKYAAARLAKKELTNGKMMQGDGLQVFAQRLPADSVAAVHVYFPDPWWKARHKKRRVLNEVFLKDVARVLVPGGSLHFWTDVEEYFTTTLELLKEVSTLSGPAPVPEKEAQHHLDYRTHFERRTRLAGQPVYRAEFVKRK